MLELDAKPEEEFYFLIKYTSNSSQQQIISIKSANSHNPRRGLQRIWKRLEERFGSPELIERSLKTKLNSFPPITNKELHRLYDLSDVLEEILSLKRDERYEPLLAYYDASVGVNPIVMKLPYNLQEKWTNTAVKYTNEHNAVYPPFHVFVRFVQEQSRIKNNPSFMYNSSLTSTNKITSPRNTTSNKAERVLTRKTSVSETLSSDIENLCPIHRSNHSLEHCRAFRAKPLDQKRKILKDNNMCFKCLSKTHKQHECTSDVKCAECGSSYHSTPLHVKRKPVSVNSVGLMNSP